MATVQGDLYTVTLLWIIQIEVTFVLRCHWRGVYFLTLYILYLCDLSTIKSVSINNLSLLKVQRWKETAMVQNVTYPDLKTNTFPQTSCYLWQQIISKHTRNNVRVLQYYHRYKVTMNIKIFLLRIGCEGEGYTANSSNCGSHFYCSVPKQKRSTQTGNSMKKFWPLFFKDLQIHQVNLGLMHFQQ